jgi:hypothetical protein
LGKSSKGKFGEDGEPGSGSWSSARSGRDAVRLESKEGSLFDSNSGFLDFSQVGNEPENTVGLHSDEISPEERERRRKLVIERFKPLADLFPKNRYVPRELSRQEKERIQKMEENMAYIQDRLLANEDLSPNERAYFYGNKLDESEEKMELMEYAKNKLQEMDGITEQSLAIINERLESLKTRKELYTKEVTAAVKEGGDRKSFEE